MPQGQVQQPRSLSALLSLARTPEMRDALASMPDAQSVNDSLGAHPDPRQYPKDLPYNPRPSLDGFVPPPYAGSMAEEEHNRQVARDAEEMAGVAAHTRQANQAFNPDFQDERQRTHDTIANSSTMALKRMQDAEAVGQEGAMIGAKGKAESDAYWAPGAQSMQQDLQRQALEKIGATVNPKVQEQADRDRLAHEDKLAALKNAIDIATMKKGTAEGIAAMEVVQRLIAGEQSSHVAPAATQYGGAMGAALAPHAPTAPTAPAGGTTRMRAPDGTESSVPNDQVAHFTAQGATIIR